MEKNVDLLITEEVGNVEKVGLLIYIYLHPFKFLFIMKIRLSEKRRIISGNEEILLL